jgi:hypothetical protein
VALLAAAMDNDKFLFVDGVEVDKKTKRQMRSHVMIGKNVGRTIRRPSNRSLAGQTSDAAGSSRTPSDNENMPLTRTSANRPRSSMIARTPGNILLTVSFPVNLTHRSMQVINQCMYLALRSAGLNYCKSKMILPRFRLCYRENIPSTAWTLR